MPLGPAVVEATSVVPEKASTTTGGSLAMGRPSHGEALPTTVASLPHPARARTENAAPTKTSSFKQRISFRLSTLAWLSTTDGSSQEGSAVARPSLREDRLEMVLHGILGQEHPLSDAAGVKSRDQMREECPARERSGRSARANKVIRSTGVLASIVTAMSCTSAGGVVPMRAARSVSHTPADRWTRAVGGCSSTPASTDSSWAATL